MSSPAVQRRAHLSEWLWTVLPVAVMGLLAAWSFWLVRSTPSEGRDASSAQELTQPDLVLKDFVVRSYGVDGQLTSEVYGASGWHHPSDESMLVEMARLRAVGRGERDRADWVTARSDSLWVNGDQTQFKLSGNAEVHKSKPNAPDQALTFLGEELFIDDGAHWVSSTEPVTVHKGLQTLRGDAMRYDQAQGVLTLNGNVRVTSRPKS